MQMEAERVAAAESLSRRRKKAILFARHETRWRHRSGIERRVCIGTVGLSSVQDLVNALKIYNLTE